MNNPEFLIGVAKHQFEPGEQISGEVLWSMNEIPKEIQLVCGWETDGRGTKDQKQEAKQKWIEVNMVGRKFFEFTLPPTPYSFSGKLIHLQWFLEMRIKNGKHVVRRDIFMAPSGQEVQLNP